MRIVITLLFMLMTRTVCADPYLYPEMISNPRTVCTQDKTVIEKIKSGFEQYPDCPDSKQEIQPIDLNGDSKCEYYVTEEVNRICEPVTQIIDSKANVIGALSGPPGNFHYASKKKGFLRIINNTQGGHRTNIIYTTHVHSFNGLKYTCEFCTDNSHGGYLDLGKKEYEKKNYKLSELYYWNAYRMYSESRLTDANNVALVLIKQNKFDKAILLLNKHLDQDDGQIINAESTPCYATNCTISSIALSNIKSAAYLNLGLAYEKKGLVETALSKYNAAQSHNPTPAVESAIERALSILNKKKR